jgi:hypothetical protein
MGRAQGWLVAHLAHCIPDGAIIMNSTTLLARACAASLLLMLAACQKAPPPAEPAASAPATEAGPEAATDAANVAAATPVATAEWPASLPVFGEGFPNPGDPCRNVGESAATMNFLDHTAWLVGCQSADDAAKLGGTVVATADGITLVSVPR